MKTRILSFSDSNMPGLRGVGISISTMRIACLQADCQQVTTDDEAMVDERFCGSAAAPMFIVRWKAMLSEPEFALRKRACLDRRQNRQLDKRLADKLNVGQNF